jgi:hypothetical protein
MNPMLNTFSRRAMLKSAAAGFGYLAFASLSTWAAEKDNPLAPKKTHFPARAKHVIFLCMEGAPSHTDTFDYKPRLIADDGKAFTRSRVGGGGKLLAPQWKYQQYGQAGLWISDLFPELAKHADELCLLNGMHTDVPAHPQAFLQMHTGISQFPRPSMGSWVLYGLGTENENVPGFVSINPPGSNGGPANYGSSFLPPVYQGTRIGSGFGRGEATVPNLTNPQRSTAAQRAQLDFLQELNRAARDQDPLDPSVDGLIESYELAFRMQGELPKLLNVNNEPASVRKLYGADDQATQNFGRQCLLARRLVEAGVRFVELTSGGWDHHRDLKASLTRSASSVDKPIAGLIADLKARDLLKDTLIIWGGEFGRTPYAQGTDGRDHNNKGFTMWMAGGGVKGGLRYGATDEYGYEAVEGKIHIHDWHATILHLLGLDHEKLTYRHAGRDFRLTDVKGNVVKDIVS